MSDKAKCKCGQEFYDATCFKNHVSNCMAAKNVSSNFEIWFNLFNSELHLRGDGIQGGTIKDFMEIAWNAQQSRIASLEERDEWISVESPPNNYATILIAIEGSNLLEGNESGVRFYRLGYYSPSAGFVDAENKVINGATHWKPITHPKVKA